MSGIYYAFLGTLFTFGVTALGALNVFALREKTDHTLQSLAFGFAGGVMVAASIWSLLLPGMERAKEMGQISFIVMPLGFLAGVLLLLLVDFAIQKRLLLCRRPEEPLPLKKSSLMLILAITAHNIPEGMAVGLAFALAASEPGSKGMLSGALALTLGIGIQNYPEGTAVAIPLIRDGMNKKKAFFIGSMSAVVEPVFGVAAAALAGYACMAMPFLLAAAAGAMIYVVVQELIPEAHIDEEDKSGTLGFVVGFIVMMILDIALGG